MSAAGRPGQRGRRARTKRSSTQSHSLVEPRTGDGLGRSSQVTLRRKIDREGFRERMAEDVREGLGSNPKTLEPKYFYDARGSRLFEEITRLPEYYQTRTERKLLRRVADDLVRQVGPEALVEYGSGDAGKTVVLLDAMRDAGLLRGYAPIDVSPEPVRKVADEFADRYPELRVDGVIADFETPIDLPFSGLPRLVCFLGSTIGNMDMEQGREFLGRVADQLSPADGFLVGFDLVKERTRLEAAYNDAQGVTAAFNRNVLRVLNRELDAEFDADGFTHLAFWNEGEGRIEMHLVTSEPLCVGIGALDMEICMEEGESIRTELSYKYTRERVERLVSGTGLSLERWETDEDDLFALGLLEETDDSRMSPGREGRDREGG